jgi:type VI secretion system protein ImpJ
MKTPQRLVWSEGMFMSPQHLQSLERFQESILSSRLGALAPLDWGVTAVEIDAAALGAGQVRLQRFAGILPQGTPLSFEENDPEAPPPRQAAPLFPAAARALDVHLCVPRERDGVSPFAEDAAARTRYLVSTRPVQDATGPAGATVPVAFARLNATLLLGDEPRDDYESLKIAEIVRGPAGQLAVSDTYVPPCLRIGAAPWVVSGMRQMLARAIGKQRELAEGRRLREPLGDQVASDLARLMQLLVLNAGIPMLAHHAEVADGSAREVYLALSQLAGQLSTFAADSDPASLPKFAYTDLRSTFEPLFARLGTLLGEMAAVQYTAVPLEQRPGGLHLARIQDDRILRSQLFLAVKSELSDQQVAEQVPRLCKIASTSEIQGLMQAAAPGLSLKVVHRPPPQIPLRAGTQYFALAPDDRHWQSILANKNIALYLPPPFDPVRTKVELFAIGQMAASQAIPGRS